MNNLAWIVIGGFLMSLIAMVGSITLVLKPTTIDSILLPLIALAAGTLLGGAFFHMIPEGTAALDSLDAAVWIMSGFLVFLGLEQFLRWHHTHQASEQVKKPVTYLILIGDAVHNFLGGLGIASTFLLNPHAGMIAWLAAAAHELPQELGDFGILVHGGWNRANALLWNFLSALAFPAGALLAYFASHHFDVSGLVLFGAGNFIYIAASDLIPEIKSDTSRLTFLHFASFGSGLGLMYLLARWVQH